MSSWLWDQHLSGARGVGCERHIRRPDPTTRDHEVVIFGHAPSSLYYLILVIGDDFYPFQLHPQGEAEASKVCGVGIDGLLIFSAESVSHAVLRCTIECSSEGRRVSDLAAQHLVAYYNATGRVYHPFLRFRIRVGVG